jgi:type IV pilus assembly protein PilM
MPIAVGLDIGSEAVRAAAVDTGSATPVLRRFAEMPLPPGAVVAGEIADEGAVVEALNALWKRHHLPRKRLVVGIANQRVIVRQVDVPHLEEEELVEALPYQVQDAIPIPVEEAVLDYVPMEEFTTPDGDLMLSILVVAAQREMVEGLVSVTRRADLQVMSIDLQAFGLVRAAFGADLTKDSEGTQGLLDIGATLTQIAVTKAGITRFVRIIPSGGSQFTEALVAGASLSREDAEERKRSIGVVPSGMPGGDDEQASLSRILTRTADGLIEEIRGSVNYYLTQAGEHSLQRLIVCGNGARLPHLANRVARALGTRVEPVRVLDHVSVGRIRMTEPQLLELQAVLPAAVGLALWGSYVVPPRNRFAHLAKESS